MLKRFDQIVSEYGPFLDDLWKIFYRTAIFFAILFIIGFFYAGDIVKKLISLFHLTNVSIIITSPFAFLDLAGNMGFFVASFLATPFFIWQVYAFLKPAMSSKEFRILITYIPISLFFFVFGFAYGFLALYWGLDMIAQLNASYGLQNMWDAGTFISQLSMTSTLLGFLFQFPLLAMILLKLGILDKEFLIRKRRVAYACIVIIVSLLPPTDGISLIVMSVPLVFLYELIILWSNFLPKK